MKLIAYSVLIVVLFGQSSCADECLSYDETILLNQNQKLALSQANKGEDFILTITVDHHVLKRKVNSYLRVSAKKNFGLMCPISAGVVSSNLFEIIDFRNEKTVVIESDLEPLDDVDCRISENENYVIVYDDFVSPAKTYLFDMTGKQIGIYEGEFRGSLNLGGELIMFPDTYEFGGINPLCGGD